MKNLRLHQICSARLIEIQEGAYLLLSFDGQLIRVRDLSANRYELGQSINLEVVALSPLRFRVAHSDRGSWKRSI